MLQYARLFIPHNIIEWNNLPSDIATEPDPVKFHDMLHTVN